MKRLLVIIAILMFSLPLVKAQENKLNSDDTPYYCPNKSGAFYQAHLFPRYDVATHSLLLIDDATNQSVRTLDTFDENVRIVNWSPDCRYLTGVVGTILHGYKPSDEDQINLRWNDPDGVYVGWKIKEIAFWDAVNGGRLQILRNAGNYTNYPQPLPVIWSADGNYALILSGCNTVMGSCLYDRIHYDFIWQSSNTTVIRVGGLPIDPFVTSRNENDYSYSSVLDRSSFNQYYWDLSRGWLWGSGAGGVSAYDVNTGVEVRFFQNNSRTESRFLFSQDDTKVIIYSIAQPGSRGDAGITIYDIDSQVGVSVNVEGFAAPEIPLANYHPVALSADNRYLAVGYDAIRVWDIQNLPEKVEDRLPIYRHAGPKALIQSLRFSDWDVIETSSSEGVQHWDLHTGAFLAN